MSWAIDYWDKASNVSGPPKRPKDLRILRGLIERNINPWADVIREHVREDNEIGLFKLIASKPIHGRHPPRLVIPALEQHRPSRLKTVKRPSQPCKIFHNHYRALGNYAIWEQPIFVSVGGRLCVVLWITLRLSWSRGRSII